MANYDPNNLFAKILRGELPCHKVYEDDRAFAFLDIMPRAPGHTLVIPKAPARNILDVDPDDLAHLAIVSQKIAKAGMKVFKADGVTMQQFSERAGGQVVFHLHVHIIPRQTASRSSRRRASRRSPRCCRTRRCGLPPLCGRREIREGAERSSFSVALRSPTDEFLSKRMTARSAASSARSSPIEGVPNHVHSPELPIHGLATELERVTGHRGHQRAAYSVAAHVRPHVEIAEPQAPTGCVGLEPFAHEHITPEPAGNLGDQTVEPSLGPRAISDEVRFDEIWLGVADSSRERAGHLDDVGGIFRPHRADRRKIIAEDHELPRYPDARQRCRACRRRRRRAPSA